jgi:hypothetical protein
MSCEFKLGEPVLARIAKDSDWEEVVFIAYDDTKVCKYHGEEIAFPYLCARCSAKGYTEQVEFMVSTFSEVKEFPIELKELEEEYDVIRERKADVEKRLYKLKESTRKWGE